MLTHFSCSCALASSQPGVWLSLSQLPDWLHLARTQAASCHVGYGPCVGNGSADAAAFPATAVSAFTVSLSSLSDASLWSRARAAVSSLDATGADPWAGCVCDELCVRVLLAVRGVQVASVERAVSEPSDVLLPLLSSSSFWCSLLTDMQPQSQAASHLATFALLPLVQRLLAACVRLAASTPSEGRSPTLSHFLLDSLFPALRSALSRCSDHSLVTSADSVDISSVSATLRAVPRSLVYCLAVSACVAGAESVGHSLPTSLQSLWCQVMYVVDLSAASVPEFTRSLSLSFAASSLPPSLLTVASYAVGRLSLVRCLTSSPAAPTHLLPLLHSAGTAPSGC